MTAPQTQAPATGSATGTSATGTAAASAGSGASGTSLMTTVQNINAQIDSGLGLAPVSANQGKEPQIAALLVIELHVAAQLKALGYTPGQFHPPGHTASTAAAPAPAPVPAPTPAPTDPSAAGAASATSATPATPGQ